METPITLENFITYLKTSYTSTDTITVGDLIKMLTVVNQEEAGKSTDICIMCSSYFESTNNTRADINHPSYRSCCSKECLDDFIVSMQDDYDYDDYCYH